MKILTMPVEVVAIQYTQETLIEAFLEFQDELISQGLGAILEVNSSGNIVIYYGTKDTMKEENYKELCYKLPILENHGVLLFYWDMAECIDLKEYFERFPSEKKSKNKKAGK